MLLISHIIGAIIAVLLAIAAIKSLDENSHIVLSGNLIVFTILILTIFK